MIALIPARSGSKRIPDKNIKDFFGHPLMAYTIQAAKDSGIFGNKIYVSSDSTEYLDIAQRYGARKIIRPDFYATEYSPDAEWIDAAFKYLRIPQTDFMILRITSPFKMGWLIKDVWDNARSEKRPITKTVRVVNEHPYKMWGGDGWNIFNGRNHLKQSNSLSKFYIQTGSAEVRLVNIKRSWREILTKSDQINLYYLFGAEALDINTPEDWILAEELVKRGLAKLPEIK